MVQETSQRAGTAHGFATVLAVVLLFALAVPSAGGEKEGGPPAPDSAKPRGEAEEGESSNKESLEPIKATVNGAVITHFDIERELGPVMEVLKGSAEERKSQLQRLKKIKLRELMLIEILIQAAKRKGIKITDSMVRQELRSRAKQHGGTLAYYRLIGSHGMTYAENENDIKRGLYVRELQRRLYNSRTRTQFVYPPFTEISVRPKEIRDYYERNPADFQEEKPGRFRILWLRSEDFGSLKATRDKAEALHGAISARTDPAARTEAFSKAAKEFSSHDSAPKGGAMPLTREQTLAPELNTVLENLEPGAISSVISTDVGFFLLYLEQPFTRVPRPFDDVQSEIMDILRNQKLRIQLKGEEDRLMSLARIWPEEMAKLLWGERK